MHTAKKIRPLSAYQEIGWVRQVEESSLWVDAGAGAYRAVRALSCLVEPMVGDRVLLAVADDEAFVLAVLQREATAVTLGVPGDLDVRVTGNLRMAASAGVDIVSTEHVGMTAKELKVHFHGASVFIDQLSHVGALVSANLRHLRIQASTVESTVERVAESIKRAYRVVSEFDHVRARRIDYAAKETMNLRGANTLITAEELVKIDGSQIHLG